MTEQRPPTEPVTDDEIVRPGDRSPGDTPDGRPGDEAKPPEPNPLVREGADAPDAADIEDPDEQL